MSVASPTPKEAEDKKTFINFYKEDKKTAPKGFAGVIHCKYIFILIMPSCMLIPDFETGSQVLETLDEKENFLYLKSSTTSLLKYEK